MFQICFKKGDYCFYLCKRKDSALILFRLQRMPLCVTVYEELRVKASTGANLSKALLKDKGTPSNKKDLEEQHFNSN